MELKFKRKPKAAPAVEPLEVTNIAKMSGLPWGVVMSTANSIFAYLTLFGSVMVLFLNQLEFSNTQIGLTLGVLYITGVFSVFMIRFVSRIGFKRGFQRFMTARAMVIILLLFTPYVWERFGQPAVFWYVITIVGLFAVFRTVALTGWMPWVGSMSLMRCGASTLRSTIFSPAFPDSSRCWLPGW